MGTVLHQRPSQTWRCKLVVGFSPLSRRGRCCIRLCTDYFGTGRGPIVSVPFSMGTVLHPERWDSMACSFCVSVPFSMGTVLHLVKITTRLARSVEMSSTFQSPSRWGRCCISVKHRIAPPAHLTTVPCFSPLSRWGRCWVSFAVRVKVSTSVLSFSPLLDGDGVASIEDPSYYASIYRFSPLLDGDGVASSRLSASRSALIWFQSPSRWGRCCIGNRNRSGSADSAFQSPSRWGRCCIGNLGWMPSLPISRSFQSPSRWGRCCIKTAPDSVPA